MIFNKKYFIRNKYSDRASSFYCTKGLFIMFDIKTSLYIFSTLVDSLSGLHHHTVMGSFFCF